VRPIILLFIILVFSSCAKNAVEESKEAIDVALTYLSSGKCEEALSVLEEIGNQPTNAIYLQVLASAHACKAGFNEIAFVNDDLTSIDATSGSTIMKTASVMLLSDDTEADSANFTAIKNAYNIILNSTAGEPSQQTRIDSFGTRKSGDMGVQALILNIVNLGKFLHYYGNVDAAGVKGAGAGTNSCFLNYNDPRAQLVTGAATGACTVDNDGHADLDQSTEEGKRRLCEGLMLISNTLDILDNIDLTGSSSLSKMEDVQAQVITFRTNATAVGLGTLINMTSQSECETYLDTPAQLLDMEYLYAVVFEIGLQ
jgi:hypothetical protein